MSSDDDHQHRYGDESEAEQWEACPLGTLKNMAARLVAVERAQKMKRMISRTSLALVAVAGVLFAANGVNRAMRPGGISCAECHGHFAQYYAHVTDAEDAGLEGAMANSMREHLAACRVCRDAFREAYPAASSAIAKVWRRDGSTAAALAAVQQ